MKLLHTSDWHIGRQFHNVSLLEDQQHVLQQILKIAETETVDAVLIAGDIYDRSVPPALAVKLLDDVLHTLCKDLAIPVLLISGNHDGAERLAFGSRQLQASGLHIIGSIDAEPKPVVLQDQFGEVAFYGIPYLEPNQARQVFGADVSSHDDALQAIVNAITDSEASLTKGTTRRTVVLSHCFIDGGEESESERPLSVGGADRVSQRHFLPFNYTALGHLHAPQYKGAEHIRYSGSILKYSFSEERQKKSVTLVEMNAKGDCEIEKIPLKPLREMRSIEGKLEDILEQGKTDPQAEDYLLIRLQDKAAILDVMGKLRQVYPNVLHLERPGLMTEASSHTASRERLNKGEMNLFEDFYQQVCDEPLSAEQKTLMEKVINAARKGKDLAEVE